MSPNALVFCTHPCPLPLPQLALKLEVPLQSLPECHPHVPSLCISSSGSLTTVPGLSAEGMFRTVTLSPLPPPENIHFSESPSLRGQEPV
jgi:hypothetical protein